MSENINGESDYKIIELMAWNHAKAIWNLLTFLINFVLINIVAIDKLIKQVDLSSFLEHHWVFDFEGEFMLDLNIADSKAIL